MKRQPSGTGGARRTRGGRDERGIALVLALFMMLAMSVLGASTTALKGDDATYDRIEGQLSDLTTQRDQLASAIKSQLDAAAFDGRSLNQQQAKREIREAKALIEEAGAVG